MNLISIVIKITIEMKKDAETKTKVFLGNTQINKAEVNRQMKEFFDKTY